MAQTLLILIIAFVLLDFSVSTFLSWINAQWMGHPIPEALQGIYDDKAYQRQQAYQRQNRRVATVQRGVELVIDVLLLVFGVFGWLDYQTQLWTTSHYLQLIAFFAIFQLFSTIVALPFNYYDTFVIESRFGFNKTTRKTFWGDLLKGFIVDLLITCALLCAVLWLYENVPVFWAWTTLVCAAFILFMNLFYSNLIVPLFNKQTPLEQGELRSAIEAAAREMQFPIKNIYVINGSKHSTKANAYFTGLGRKKRIVLYDTLMQQLTTSEIVAVLSHEIGHYKHHDIIFSMVTSIVMTGIYFFVFSLLVGNPDLSAALGGIGSSFALSVVAFSLLLSPLNLVLKPLSNKVSRRAEYRADAFAATHGYGTELIAALKKLSRNGLSNLTPHPLYVWFYFSHPTLAQRIAAIDKETAK